MTVDPAQLLAGPRGRRLCLEFVRERRGDTPEAGRLSEAIFHAAYDLDPGRGASTVLFTATPGGDQYSPPDYSAEDVARLLAVVPLAEPDAPALLSALAAAVNRARYWQEPDGEDVLATAPEVRGPLARVSSLLADSPRSAWWATPLARGMQRFLVVEAAYWPDAINACAGWPGPCRSVACRRQHGMGPGNGAPDQRSP